MKTPKPIPNTLKLARKQAGFTQLQVAERLGFASTDRICRWEKGRTFPHVVNLLKICALYNVLPHEVYTDLFSAAAEGRLLSFREKGLS